MDDASPTNYLVASSSAINLCQPGDLESIYCEWRCSAPATPRYSGEAQKGRPHNDVDYPALPYFPAAILMSIDRGILWGCPHEALVSNSGHSQVACIFEGGIRSSAPVEPPLSGKYLRSYGYFHLFFPFLGDMPREAREPVRISDTCVIIPGSFFVFGPLKVIQQRRVTPRLQGLEFLWGSMEEGSHVERCSHRVALLESTGPVWCV